MRLLFTTFTFSPQANGVAEVVTAQTRELAARGHTVTVATSWDAGRAGSENEGVSVESFRLTGGADDDPAEAKRYQDFIAAFPADVILCHCWRSWSTDLAVSALARNPAKSVLVSHGYSAHRWEPLARFPWGLGAWVRGLSYLPFTWRALHQFDHAVFLSERRDYDRFFDHRFVRWLGRPPASVIPNGTYPDRFLASGAAFRERHDLGDGPLLLCLATFAPSKNQELALRAFLQADCPDATLLFIGNEFNSYSEHLRTLGQAGRVRLRAGLPRSELAEAYAACDVVVLSSRAESQPLVLLDAMAAGRPFISTDVGCVTEMPGGVVVADQDGMAAAMRRLICEPEQRAKLAATGRAACETTYHWHRVMDHYESLLTQLTTPR